MTERNEENVVEVRPSDSELLALRQKLERLQALYWQRGQVKPHIVILGAGYAGLTCALGLRDLDVAVTLVNRNDYHYLTTLLHEPAVGRRQFAEVTVDLPGLLEGSEIELVRGEASAIDVERQTVLVTQGGATQRLSYDVLVIALGSEPEFFNIPGLEDCALTLSSWSQAKRLHLRVEEALLDYKDHPEEPWRAHIVVGGAGLTGVELAGELADWCHQVSKEYQIDPEVIQITLIDGAPTVLAACQACQDRVIPLATRILERKGVRILTGRLVKAFEPGRVLLDDGQAIEAGLVIWTGGVRGHRLIERSGLAVNRQKRARVNAFLQAQDHPEVFVVGDSAAATTADGAVLPPTAQLAIMQGPQVAQNLRRLLAGQPLQPCEPKLMGVFLSVGHRDALGVVGNRLHFSGGLARTIKNLIGYRYLASLGGWKLVWAKWRRQARPVPARPSRPPRDPRSWGQRLLAAGFAGAVGTAAMTGLSALLQAVGVPLDAPGMLSQFFGLPVLAGWGMHFGIGMMLAWLYALGFARALPGPTLARGALFGLLPFLVAQTIMLPLMGVGPFASRLGALAPGLALGSLLVHLVYGAVTGWSYAAPHGARPPAKKARPAGRTLGEFAERAHET